VPQDKKSKISEKSKKSEILEAYQELLKKIEETTPISSQEKKVEKEKQEILFNSLKLNDEKIIKNIVHLKLTMGQNLDQLEQVFSEEYRKLSDLQKAIEIETKSIEELYEIKKNARTLEALLLAQKERKDQFDLKMEKMEEELTQEIEVKKQLWKKEEEEFETEKKEQALQLKKERMREEEDYNYALQLKRKKDNNLYEEKKQALEKELLEKKLALETEFSKREKIISAQEEEFKNLKKEVELFPQKIEDSVKQTENSITEKLEREFSYKTELKTQEYAGEKKLNLQTISSLKEKIKEQEEIINQLTQKANTAGNQVQTIAIKAIEGASASRCYGTFNETKKSQQSTNI